MSLIICSNRSNAEGESIYKPYSFQNPLNQQIEIPTNAEIALQSIKVNKSGLFTLSNQNNVFYQYIGTKLTDTFTFDKSPRGVARTQAFVGINQSFGAFTPEELATKLDVGVAGSLYHPDYQGLSTVSAERNGSGTDFEGYNFTFDKSVTASGTTAIYPGAQDFIPAVTGVVKQNFQWQTGNKHFKNTSASGNSGRAVAIATNAPLSLSQGHFEFDHRNASEWSVGLVRYCDPNASHYYFNDGDSDGLVQRDLTAPEYCRARDVSTFYDYSVDGVTNLDTGVTELRMYHAVCDNTGDDEIKMEEVIYYGYTGATLTQPYDLDTNGSAATGFRFVLDGEKVIVEMMNGTAVLAVLCSPDLGTPAKVNHFKPIAMTCSYLYPKIEVVDHNHYIILTDLTPRVITGFEYSGIDNSKSPTLRLQDRQTNMDWWATLVNIGTSGLYGRIVDTRVFNAMLDPETHSFVGTSGGKINYNNVLVLSESDVYVRTLGANAAKTLGFPGRSVVDTPTSTNASAVTFISDVVPKLISPNSIFIRVNNFTHRSTNAGTGNQSKIIYHCPRFDSSGNETGGLFYEPGDRTYLKLHNIAPMSINSIDIDIVNEDETFATGLVGKTIVCLHIRESKE